MQVLDSSFPGRTEDPVRILEFQYLLVVISEVRRVGTVYGNVLLYFARLRDLRILLAQRFFSHWLVCRS